MAFMGEKLDAMAEKLKSSRGILSGLVK